MSFARTVVASPAGNNPPENGAALRAVYASAVASSAGHQFVVLVEPGDYDLGTEIWNLAPNVHLIGFGRGVTRIVAGAFRVPTAGNPFDPPLTVAHLSLRSQDATGFQSAAGLRMHDVHLRSASLFDPFANVVGLYVNGSSADLRRVQVDCEGENVGVGISLAVNPGQTSPATTVLQDVDVKITGVEARGIIVGSGSFGISSPTLLDRVTVQSGYLGIVTASIGPFGPAQTITVRDSTVGPTQIGLRSQNDGQVRVRIETSSIAGSQYAVLLLGDARLDVRLIGSQVGGFVQNNSPGNSVVRCLNSYNATFDPVDAFCF
jgi:hypothetical protein